MISYKTGGNFKILPFFRDQMWGIFVVHIDFQEDKTWIFYDITFIRGTNQAIFS